MGYGAQLAYAGAGADESLEKMIERRLREVNQAAVIENMRAQRENEARRIDNDTALRQASLASMDDARKEKAAALQQAQITGALRMAPQGAVIDPALAAKAREIGLGSQLNHQDSALASTSMAGGAMAGGKAPVMGQLRMQSNAGHPERDINLGTADQQQVAQAREDRIAAETRAREERDRARAEAQQAREDLARLTASLRTPPAGPQPQVFYDGEGKPHALRFTPEGAVEIPLPSGVVGKAAPKPAAKTPEQIEAEARARAKGTATGKQDAGSGGLFDMVSGLFGGGEDKPAKIRARDQNGKLHEAPAGTPLPPGWKLEG